MLTNKPSGNYAADVAFEAIAFDASPRECALLGRELADRAERVAIAEDPSYFVASWIRA
ncbi:Uncharacterised protein [Nocardia otitidiscaviarum]|uniref:Uncharacterized protein n=1 Tax=Nocardia otitidiscaviarum TaxID=1823 RepID=A0A378YB85_9NOCA|nr:hypothetical protein [Nocardia otitidiscaviarum]SUA73800.1 Uncharacterised protein [Nocardia otitidiscaviarum]